MTEAVPNDAGRRVGVTEPDVWRQLADLVDDRPEPAPGAPVLLGVAGPVAVGKSTVAAALADHLGVEGRRVEVISTDSFLLPNAELEAVGGAMRKGYPESYDWSALEEFLAAVRAGRDDVAVPVYSHESFDIVAGEHRHVGPADVVIVEGLNLLQDPPAGATVTAPPRQRLDTAVYLSAPRELLRGWFVQRFVDLARPDDGEPADFYRMFDDLDRDELRVVARWTWDNINAPNVVDHVEPTRRHAQVVVHKGLGHRIERIEEGGSVR